MITIDGKKMGKSYGNFITLDEFFTGSHPKLSQPYSPMTIRFFILMAHYRSTVDFSNDALQGAEKGMKRLMEGFNSIARIKPVAPDARTVATLEKITSEERAMYEALDDDLNTPIVISHLFELVSLINKLIDGSEAIDAAGVAQLTAVMKTFIFDLLGLRDESGAATTDAHAEAFGGAVDLLLALRAKAKADKDWATSDMIRNRLSELGFSIKDTKDGATWSL
jgi:cysteinyl-tRNA synthetase